jgi:hypothetical protein
MRAPAVLKLSVLLLGALPLLGAECLPIPDIQEKAVELAVGGAVTVQFVAEGLINYVSDEVTVDIADSLDLRQIIIDAGIDPDDVTDVKMSGAAYRVVEPDPTEDRQIQDGQVTIERSGGSEQALITDFDEYVNTVVDFKTAPLDSAGVTVINDLLGDLLVEVQGGPPATNTEVTFRVSGYSVPAEVPTDFVWELKVLFSITGVIHVDMVEF